MISVIIPTYNRASTILRSLNSVLNQTFTDIEVIVIDDGSTDNTEVIVKGLQNAKVRFVKRDGNHGACDARNYGIRISRGSIIAFQDSDDVWRPRKLEKQIELLEATSADICFSRFESHSVNTETPLTVIPRYKAGIIPYKKLVTHFMVGTPTIIAKRKVFEENLFDPELPRLQDFDWIIRAARGRTVVMSDDVLVDAYVQDDSISSAGWENMESALVGIIRKGSGGSDGSAMNSFLYRCLAKCRAMQSLPYAELLREAYRINPSTVSLSMYLLSKVGLMDKVWKQKR